MKTKASSFERLAKEVAKVYNIKDAPEVFDGSYEEQARSPSFISALLFNCMVMNSLYNCRRGGCIGCRARSLFDTVTDIATRRLIDEAMVMLMNESANRRHLS